MAESENTALGEELVRQAIRRAHRVIADLRAASQYLAAGQQYGRRGVTEQAAADVAGVIDDLETRTDA